MSAKREMEGGGEKWGKRKREIKEGERAREGGDEAVVKRVHERLRLA